MHISCQLFAQSVDGAHLGMKRVGMSSSDTVLSIACIILRVSHSRLSHLKRNTYHTQQGNFLVHYASSLQKPQIPKVGMKIERWNSTERMSKNKMEIERIQKPVARYCTNQKEKRQKNNTQAKPMQCGPHTSKTGVWRAYVGWSTVVHRPITSLVILLLFCHIIVFRHI